MRKTKAFYRGKREINMFSYSWCVIKYFLTRGMYGPHFQGKCLRRKDKPPCPVLQVRIWSGQIHGHSVFQKNGSVPLNGMGYRFLHLMFVFVGALSPGSRAEHLRWWPLSKSSTQAPQNDFWFAAWQDWSRSWGVTELDQLYPQLTCLSTRTFEFQSTSLFVVPQWSSNLLFRVVLAPEILVIINQVKDKTVAKT